MISIDKAVIARLRKGGEDFEVLVDLDKALDFRRNKTTIDEVLVAYYIYKDSKKGMKANEHEMEKFFKTKDVKEVASIILKEGEIQLTKEHRDKLREEKRKKIIELIHRNAINPQTNLPHPSIRIENAIKEAKVHIDEFKNAEEQIEGIVEKLRPIIPIRFEVKKLLLKIPARYTTQSYKIIKRFGRVLNESWGNDGSLSITLEIPGGIQMELIDEMNNITHGEIEIK